MVDHIFCQFLEGSGMQYKKPKRIFEDSGVVNPKDACHVLLDNVTNTRGQDIKTMVIWEDTFP